MDFWAEDAVFYNRLCLYADERQDLPGAGACTVEDNQPSTIPDDCLTATDVQAGRADDPAMVSRTRGAGCKNDGGPLWITVQLQDNEEGISGTAGGGDLPRSVVAKLFQKKGTTKKTARRARRASRYAEVNDKYPTEKKSDLVECMSLQLCTATMN